MATNNAFKILFSFCLLVGINCFGPRILPPSPIGNPAAFVNNPVSQFIFPEDEPLPPEAQKVLDTFPKIPFGERNVSVLAANATRFENGTVTTELALQNGIGYNVELLPKEENGKKYYAAVGQFEFRTPDKFSYVIQFEANNAEFKLIKFERKTRDLLRTNPKLLAALAG